MSRIRTFWSNYKVLIVMGPALGFIHWGWYVIKSSPALHQREEDYIPEPAIVSYVTSTSSQPLSELKKNNKEAKTRQ